MPASVVDVVSVGGAEWQDAYSRYFFWLEVLKGGDLFLATSEVTMNSGRASPATLQVSGLLTPPGILQSLRFPDLAVFSPARATLPVAT